VTIEANVFTRVPDQRDLVQQLHREPLRYGCPYPPRRRARDWGPAPRPHEDLFGPGMPILAWMGYYAGMRARAQGAQKELLDARRPVDSRCPEFGDIVLPFVGRFTTSMAVLSTTTAWLVPPRLLSLPDLTPCRRCAPASGLRPPALRLRAEKGRRRHPQALRHQL